MIGGVQKKILLTQDENGNLRMDDEMGKLLFGDPNPSKNYKLVRESDGLTKHGQTAGWIEWKKKDKTLNIKKNLTSKESRELEGLPEKIELMEKEQEELSGKMSDPIFYENKENIVKATSRMKELGVEIAEAYERWEFLGSF